MSADRRLEIQIEVRGELVRAEATIRVIGEFDRRHTVRFDEAATSLPRSVTAVTVDLTRTTIIDSAALGSLVRLRHQLDGNDGLLTVEVRRNFQSIVMRVGGLFDYLRVSETDEP